MLTDENLRAAIEGIIYVSPEPVTIEMVARSIVGEERSRIKAVLEELVREYERPEHGISIRQVAGGYKFSSKVEHHEVFRSFVKNLKPPIRLSKPALETLAVIAYRQPVTLPEIEEIRGVDCGGVAHTLLEKKLVVTAGRKNVVGRPILYRTSRDFLVHFGLKDVGELPSLKEFEELARHAAGMSLPGSENDATGGGSPDSSQPGPNDETAGAREHAGGLDPAESAGRESSQETDLGTDVERGAPAQGNPLAEP